MLESVKSYFTTNKYGKLIAIFILSGLISVATQIGCPVCNTFLSGALTSVQTTERTAADTATTIDTSDGIAVDSTEAQ